MRFQRLIQVPVLLLFLILLWSAAYPLPSWLEVDLFLRLDPMISLGSMVAARAFLPRLIWGLIIVGLGLFIGRVFCGYLCPMGTTVDLADWFVGGKKKGRDQNSFEASGRCRNWKYLILVFVGGTALVGIASHFLFSPLSLITRFYAFVLYPLALMVSNLFLDVFRPLFPLVGLDSLAFAHFPVPSFNTNLFIAFLVVGILALGVIQPRFWCRNLCPAGALMGLFSRKPLFRRHVSQRCSKCGRCVRVCPMGAIGEDFVTTAHSECTTCLRCREICPEKAISFRITRSALSPSPEIDLNRRRVITAGIAGAATAALTLTSLDHLHGGENPRALRSSRLIRPPGSLPESQFQARCVRCGECMKACLTNTLQPVWFEAGVSGLWTPKITARLAGCEQNCSICGRVCPTGAIRSLSLTEKVFAKVGTARIIKSRCIAWEQDKQCLICDEICPYNAISSRFMPGQAVIVPVVDENKCNGCGYCENKCPVAGESAIVVEPLGELRLASGSYREKARELGLVFHARTTVQDQFILDSPKSEPPGDEGIPKEETKKEEPGLPPGFIVRQ